MRQWGMREMLQFNTFRRKVLSKINLLYGMSSVVTKISIITKHCDTEVRPIAETVFQSNSPYRTVQSFLDDFRQNRFPSFHDDCRLAFNDMKQHPKETAFDLNIY